MIRLFCGYELRESVGFHAFVHSVIAHATKPVAIVPMTAMGLPEGSNAFTLSRFMVPALCGYEGHAIFVDASDMLMLADVAELDALFDPQYAIQVVKHPSYKTRHKVKYKGTPMECPNLNYDRKNWASVSIIHCAHPAWRDLDLTAPRVDILRLQFLPDEAIGALPDEWNRLVDEGHPVEGAKVLHWTAGIPGFPCYSAAPGASHWHKARAAMELVT